MTNYTTKGSLYLGNLTREQVNFFERLFATMNLIDDCQLARQASWQPASKLAGYNMALTMFEQADPPLSIASVAWEDCRVVANDIATFVRVDVNRWPVKDASERLEKINELLTRVAYVYNSKVELNITIEDMPYVLAIMLGEEGEANEAVNLLQDIKTLVLYEAIKLASGSDDELERLAWDLVLDEDSWHVPSISANAEQGYVGFYDDENFNIDFMEPMLRRSMELLDVDWTIKIEWANDASRPVPDAYGGGVVVMNRKDSVWVNTGYFGSVIGPNILRGPHCPNPGCLSTRIECQWLDLDDDNPSRARQVGTCLDCGTHLITEFLYQKSTVVEE